MNKLLELAETLTALAKLPDTTKEAIESQHSEIKTQNEKIQSLENMIQSVSDKQSTLESSFRANDMSKNDNPYSMVLKANEDGFADDSWEEIIAKGQAIQASVWIKKEEYWSERVSSPSGPGWLGTSAMPIIQIVCIEPEYFFHNTVRLPGRFQVVCPTRWGSILRFFGDGDRVLIDDIAYGVATKAPVGLYVEPSTTVQTSAGDMISRPFEQGVENLILVAHNGTMPVYLAQNQDRFWMRACNVQQHQGRNSDYIQIGVKHGPPLKVHDYPFPSIQSTEGNVYLADPVFDEIQFEGPHSHKSPQAAIFISGNNMRFSDLNLYGWKMGIYAHGGQGRTLTMTMHHGQTADGREFAPKNQMLPFIFCTRPGANPDMVPDHVAGFKGWVLPKRSKAPKTAGWHNKGELLF